MHALYKLEIDFKVSRIDLRRFDLSRFAEKFDNLKVDFVELAVDCENIEKVENICNRLKNVKKIELHVIVPEESLVAGLK